MESITLKMRLHQKKRNSMKTSRRKNAGYPEELSRIASVSGLLLTYLCYFWACSKVREAELMQ